MQVRAVPDGWTCALIGDLAKVETGGTPSRKRHECWGGPINWMASGEVHQRRVRWTQESITETGLAASNA